MWHAPHERSPQVTGKAGTLRKTSRAMAPQRPTTSWGCQPGAVTVKRTSFKFLCLLRPSSKIVLSYHAVSLTLGRDQEIRPHKVRVESMLQRRENLNPSA